MRLDNKITPDEIFRNMFTHFSASSVRSARFGVKRGVKRPFSPQVIEHFHQEITLSQPIQKDKHDKSVARTGRNNHSETPYNTAFCSILPN